MMIQITEDMLREIRRKIFDKYATDAQFSKESGLHRNTVGNIVRGNNRFLSRRTAQSIEKFLDITLI